MTTSYSISPNARRWLDTISYAEGTWDPNKGVRYDITFGYQNIPDLSRHPDRVVSANNYSSAAAGGYQFMPDTWKALRNRLNLPDFGPRSQDLGALELMREKGVDPDRDPISRENIAKLAPVWASLPTMEGKSYWGQPVKDFSVLKRFKGDTVTVGRETPTKETETIPPRAYQESTPSRDSGIPTDALLDLIRDRFGVSDKSTYPTDTTTSNALEKEKNNREFLRLLLNDRYKELQQRSESEKEREDDVNKFLLATSLSQQEAKAAMAKLIESAISSFKTYEPLI